MDDGDGLAGEVGEAGVLVLNDNILNGEDVDFAPLHQKGLALVRERSVRFVVHPDPLWSKVVFDGNDEQDGSVVGLGVSGSEVKGHF